MAKSIFWKRVWTITVIILAVLIISLTYFVISNEAPITKGEVHYGIEYKEGLSLDLYTPTNSLFEEIPVVVFFHGGGWIAGRKESINMNRFNGAINMLRESGYAVITPEYTLATKTKSPFPDCIIDAFAAIKWIEDNYDQYHFDLKNIGAFGESAGAHIAMMVSYTDPIVFNADPPSISMNYVVDVYGPTDMNGLYNAQAVDSVKILLKKLPESITQYLDITQRIFGFDPDLDSIKTLAFMNNYSPLTYVGNNSPPTIIIQGSDDILVPLDQSVKMDSALTRSDVEHKLYVLEKVNHAFFGASEAQMDSVQNWIVGFIKKHYER